MKPRFLLTAAFAALANVASAAPLLAPVFSDHAVLQRGQPIRVWGRGPAQRGVAIDLSGASRQRHRRRPRPLVRRPCRPASPARR
jgi:hypothetical protein